MDSVKVNPATIPDEKVLLLRLMLGVSGVVAPAQQPPPQPQTIQVEFPNAIALRRERPRLVRNWPKCGRDAFRCGSEIRHAKQSLGEGDSM